MCVIQKDPDTGFVNVGAYRVAVHNKQTCTIFIEHGKHGDRISDVSVADMRVDRENVQGSRSLAMAQAVSFARSSPVISVMFPGGIARPIPACR